jgi:predicted dienelactone hydrolase
MRSRRLTAFGGALAAAALAVTGLVVGPGAAGAQSNPYERGPAPTATSVTQQRGPFAIQQQRIQGSNALGFNRGTVYYPTDTSQGTFGAIAVSPGFVSAESFISWTGPFLASNGFVVVTLETFGLFDFPNQRADQLQAALDYIVSPASPVDERIDRTRLGVMGHSMGGGGTLEAARDNPALQAAVPLQPWDMFVNFSGVRVPTLIVGAQNDAIAGVGSHAEPFYQQIPAASEKAYLEVAGQSHFLGNSFNATQARSALSWMKRYIDNDTRYSQFLCPPPSGSTISEYRNTCPD